MANDYLTEAGESIMMYPKSRDIDIDTFDGSADLSAVSESQPVVEEVVLGCEFDETASVIIPRKVNHRYTQKSRVKGIARFFKIYNDIYLHQSIESFRNKNDADTRINLTFLNPEPIRQKHVAWNWLYSALVACLLGVQFIYIGEYSNFDIAHPYMLPIGTLIVTAGMIFTQIFFYRTQDKIIYQSYVAQVPLIELFHRPKETDYQIFTGTLELHIRQAQQREGLNMKHRLKGELSDLRRLSEEGEITVEAYEKARAVILNHEEYR